jgi:hypothetical protein
MAKLLPKGTSITDSFGILAFLKQLNATDDVTFDTSADTVMHESDSVIADFELDSDGTFSLGNNCELTYTGPDIDVIVQLDISLYTIGAIGFLYTGISLNGDLDGESASSNNPDLVSKGGDTQDIAAGDGGSSLQGSRKMALTTGDIIKPVAGITPSAGSSDCVSMFMTITITQIGF